MVTRRSIDTTRLSTGPDTRRPDVKLVYCTSVRAANTYHVEALAAGALANVEDCAEVLRVAGF